MADLIAMAKADKNKLNVINPGQGSTPHLTAELLQIKAGIAVENIPYNGAGPAIQALLAQTTPVGITALPPRASAHQVGRAAGDRDHRREALVRSARRADPAGVRFSRPGVRDLPGNVRPGRHARRRSSHRVARDTLEVLGDPVVIGRGCAASASTCAPAARKASPRASRRKCRCGATLIVKSKDQSCRRRPQQRDLTGDLGGRNAWSRPCRRPHRHHIAGVKLRPRAVGQVPVTSNSTTTGLEAEQAADRLVMDIGHRLEGVAGRCPHRLGAVKDGAGRDRHHESEIPARQVRHRRRRRDHLHARLGHDDARARHLGGAQRHRGCRA